MSKTLIKFFFLKGKGNPELAKAHRETETERTYEREKRKPNLMRNAGDRSLVQFASKKLHKRQTRGTTSSLAKRSGLENMDAMER
jgi:hypothetical protein